MPPKKSDIQLYADECFPLTTVLYLRSLGYSIKHAAEYHMLNKTDPQHFKFAKHQKRTLITLDRDFLSYTEKLAKNSNGIIVITTGSNTPKHINLICKKQMPKITKKTAVGKLLLITNDTITKTSKGPAPQEKNNI